MKKMKKIGIWIPTQIFNHTGEELFTCLEIYIRASDNLLSYSYQKGAVKKIETTIREMFITHSGCSGMLLTLAQIHSSN